jgi:hypothetical protein
MSSSEQKPFLDGQQSSWRKESPPIERRYAEERSMLTGKGRRPPMAEMLIAISSIALLLGPSVLASFVDLDRGVPE